MRESNFRNRPRGNVITKHLKNVAITNLTVSATTYWMIIYNAFQAEWKFGSFGQLLGFTHRNSMLFCYHLSLEKLFSDYEMRFPFEASKS